MLKNARYMLKAEGRQENSLVPNSQELNKNLSSVMSHVNNELPVVNSEQLQTWRATETMALLSDNLLSMPEWKFHRWISELTNCKTPAVRKAVSHLELIHNNVPGLASRLSGQEKVGQAASSGSVLPTNPASDTHSFIEEIILLVSELESDRKKTMEKYLKEIRRADWLRKQIDELRIRHLRELPTLVQREHEACIMDMTELQWHVAYTKRLQMKAQERFCISNKSNAQLREQIDFVKQHVPLVQEKLVLEVDAMDNIRKAQGQADQELAVAKQKQAKVYMRSQEAATKASTERGHMKRELDSTRNSLTTISDQLNDAKVTYKAYTHQMNDIYKKLAENDKETEILAVKNENAKSSEAAQALIVQNLQLKTTEAEFDFRRLENDIKKQEQEYDLRKEHHFQVKDELERKKKTTEKQLQMAVRENMEKSLEVQEYEDKVAKLDQQKAADIKNINRMNQDIERTTALLQQAIEQHRQISNTHSHLQNQIQLEKETARRMEEKLKKTETELRSQAQEEVHTSKVLEARISADLAQLDKLHIETQSKKDKANSITDELEKAVSSVLEKVNKLQATRLERQQQKEDVVSQIQITEERHQERSLNFSQTFARVEPQYQSVQADLELLSEQLRVMEADSSMMKTKIEEMDAAQTIMGRYVAKAESEIQILTADMQELNLQIEAGKKMADNLRKQVNETVERLRDNDIQHKNLYKDRQQVRTKHENDKAQLMERNQQLAVKYRQLQKEYLLRKEAMLKCFDERVQYEAAITDMKQLKSLQSKLHDGLVEFFKVSGLYGKSALTRLEQESFVNAVRVSELQVNMQKTLEDITHFLHARKSGKWKHSTLGPVCTSAEPSQILTLEDGIKS